MHGLRVIKTLSLKAHFLLEERQENIPYYLDSESPLWAFQGVFLKIISYRYLCFRVLPNITVQSSDHSCGQALTLRRFTKLWWLISFGILNILFTNLTKFFNWFIISIRISHLLTLRIVKQRPIEKRNKTVFMIKYYFSRMFFLFVQNSLLVNWLNK